MFLDSRDRLNRKGETARSLEDYRMSMIWWVFFRLRIWCFVPYSLPLIYFKVTSHLQRPKKIDFYFIWQNWIQTFNLTIYSLRNCLVYGRSCRNYSLKSFVSFGNNFVKFRGNIEMLFTSLSRSVFGKTVPCVLSTARGLLLLSGTVFPNTDLPAGE